MKIIETNSIENTGHQLKRTLNWNLMIKIKVLWKIKIKVQLKNGNKSTVKNWKEKSTEKLEKKSVKKLETDKLRVTKDSDRTAIVPTAQKGLFKKLLPVQNNFLAKQKTVWDWKLYCSHFNSKDRKALVTMTCNYSWTIWILFIQFVIFLNNL